MKKLLIACFAIAALAACETTTTTETTTTVTRGAEGEMADGAPGTETLRADSLNANAPRSPTEASNLDLMHFLTEAADANMAEVALGRLAAKKATDAEVKKFGQAIISDHKQANREIKILADKNNIALPDTMSQKYQDVYTQLSQLKGAEFNRNYVSYVVAEHERSADMFEIAAQKNQDDSLETYITNTLSLLQIHLDRARTINNRISGK